MYDTINCKCNNCEKELSRITMIDNIVSTFVSTGLPGKENHMYFCTLALDKEVTDWVDVSNDELYYISSCLELVS